MGKTRPPNDKIAIKFIALGLYFALLSFVTAALFFEGPLHRFFSFLKEHRSATRKTLTIGVSDPWLRTDPLAFDVGSRARLAQIYEPLVRLDANLNLKPSLALSYGSLNPNTWEFKLRPGALFHDRSRFTMDEVISSLSGAQKNPSSEVKDLMSTVEGIIPADQNTLHITTRKPDPLLPSKLSSIFIFKKTREGNYVGTGHYMQTGRGQSVISDNLVLHRFDEHWTASSGALPDFQTVVIKTLKTKEEKLAALKKGEVDILANVPPAGALSFSYPGFRLRTTPSLEVNFLLFNFEMIFKQPELRKVVAQALNKESLAGLAHGFAVPVSQFAAPGVFGSDSSLVEPQHDPDSARAIVRGAASGEILKTTLDLPEGLAAFGEKIKSQLKHAGIDLTVNYHSTDKLAELVRGRASPFFFFGWRFDLADTMDFLTAVVHSPSGAFGQFNGGNFRSEEIDALIEEAAETVEPEKRLKLLRAIMKKITVEDVIGVPLFTPEILYAVSENLSFKPRVDGLVLAHEVLARGAGL